MAVCVPPVVLHLSAFLPVAVLLIPIVLKAKAADPTAVL